MTRLGNSIALSIVAIFVSVNGECSQLAGQNNNQNHHRNKNGFVQLVELLKKHGESGDLAAGFGPIIGLPDEPMSLRGAETEIHGEGIDRDSRECSIIYRSTHDNAGTSQAKTPVSVYIKRRKVSNHRSHALWFKVSLDGTLEKAVAIDGKYGEDGKVIQGSGTPINEDISSKEIRKAFNAELSYWVNDWMTKQKNLP